MNPFVVEMLASERQRELLESFSSPVHYRSEAIRESREPHLFKLLVTALGKILVRLGNRLQNYGCRAAGCSRCAG